MTNAYAQLTQRRLKLEELVTTDCDLRIRTARELFRLSLVELYTQGYWQQHPSEFRTHMRLYRASGPFRFSALASTSVPDRMAQYSP